MIRILCLIILCLLHNLSHAALTEAQRSEQIAASNRVGNAVWLTANGNNVLGLYYDPTPNTRRGAVLLLHDADGTPDWPQVIAPLRRSLGDNQWATLAIQLPALPSGLMTEEERYRQWGSETRARINAALDHINSQKITSVILLGYGTGATLGYQYLAANPPEKQAAMIKGAITIDVRDLPAPLPPDVQPVAAIEKSKLPVFDIFIQRNASAAGKSRLQAAQRAGNTKYRQLPLVGAYTDLSDADTLLSPRVRGWLKREFGGAPNPAQGAKK